MKDFICEGIMPIIYGAGQAETVTGKIAELGKKVLIVPDASFVSGGNLDTLRNRLEAVGAVRDYVGCFRKFGEYH